MSNSLQNGARRLQRLKCLKYCNALKWENRSILSLNAAKNTCSELNFLQKSQWMYINTNLSNNDMSNFNFVKGKLSLKVYTVTLNHVIDATVWYFGYNKVFSSTLRLC